MRAFLTAWVWGVVAITFSGCSCSGGTLGEPCTDATDCSAGEVCDPDLMVCWRPGPDYDGGGDTDGATTRDGTVPTDDGAIPIDDGAIPTDGTITIVDGRVCMELDGDGVTDCAGDCDDSDPTAYPGAPEICGDGIDNSCSGTIDSGCGGIGTYVATGVGNDANPGTRAMPVATIREGIAHAMTIGGGVDVYVAEGTYAEAVTMTEGISLHGGYESTGWTNDPAANVTTINATADTGVSFPHGITRMTSIDGFVLRGRSGVPSSAAVTVQDSSSPTIENNVIRAGNATGSSVAVFINPAGTANAAASPLVRNNDVRLGGAGTGWGGGNGSFGIRALRTGVEIVGNRVSLAEARTVQRGIEIFGCPDSTVVSFNVVRHPSGVADVAYGIRVASSGATLDKNDVWAGRCANFCVGMALEGSLTTVVMTNNISFGGDGATTTAAGLFIAFEGLPATSPDVLVHSNFLDGGRGSSGGMTAGIWMGERPASPLTVGRIFDNIIRGGSGGRRFGVFENHANIDPERFENNAISVVSASASSPTVLYYDEGATALTTIGAVNALAMSANNLQNACNVMDPQVDGDFHLGTPSMCIDAGTATEAPPDDYEGDVRPGGSAPDIGVDET